MKRLTKLANKYETDKGTEYSFAHGFTEYYEPYFEKYEHPVILELGVKLGSSEKMLYDFYDGDCEIYCVDIDPCCNSFEGYEKIKFFECDLSKRENIDELISKLGNVKFDIIIDDASHQWNDQMICLLKFSDLVKENGIYVLEDLHTSYHPETFSDGGTFYDSPLCFLTQLFTNKYLAFEESYKLSEERIKDVLIFSLYNSYMNGRSITSIITFKE